MKKVDNNLVEKINDALEERAGDDRRTKRKVAEYINPSLDRRKSNDRRNVDSN